MVHVEAVTPLRRLLSDARPSWSEKDLAAVEEKLSRVGATTVGELAKLLAHGLNKRLHAAGLKAFNSETLAALRNRLETESRSGLDSSNDKRAGDAKDENSSQTNTSKQEMKAQQKQENTESDFAKAGKVDSERNEHSERPKVVPTAKEPPPPPPPPTSPFSYSPSSTFGRAEALGETQLIKAVRQSDIRTVQYLLTHRADPNEKDNFGETALMEAAGQGQAQICRILLENAANPTCRSPSGLSATQLASEHQSIAHLCCMCCMVCLHIYHMRSMACGEVTSA